MKPDLDIDYLIFLYLRNQASDHQKQKLEQWINASEANKEVFGHMKQIWTRPTRERIDVEMKLRRDKIWESGTKKKRFGVRSDLIHQTKVAVAFLILIVGFWFSVDYISFKPDRINLVLKENPAGQKSVHMLPDGTQVWLNSESTLTYPEIFSDTLRLVKLTGEAVFEVAHDKARPFIVEAAETWTEALGTIFNIHAYPEQEQVKVALLQGSVRVQSLSEVQSSVLAPGEELLIPKDGERYSIRRFDTEKIFGWKEGILYLDGVEFKSFCEIIKKWYGVKIQVLGTPDSDWSIRARYENESLEFILKDISFNKNFIFELKGKELIINFNKKPMI